jgi:hypothetical protein
MYYLCANLDWIDVRNLDCGISAFRKAHPTDQLSLIISDTYEDWACMLLPFNREEDFPYAANPDLFDPHAEIPDKYLKDICVCTEISATFGGKYTLITTRDSAVVFWSK